MNNQSCFIASDPANSAGPIDRAGLTDVPVRGMPTMWIATRVRPIARPAKPGAVARPVTSRTTSTRRAVMSTSITKAPPMFTVLPQLFVPRAPV